MLHANSPDDHRSLPRRLPAADDAYAGPKARQLRRPAAARVLCCAWGTARLATAGGFTWLPDGKTLVTARHGKLLFWDATTGRLTKELTTPIATPEYLSFRYDLDCSADGKKLVCAGRNGHFCVCDLETGTFVSSPVPPPRTDYRQESVAIAPNGSLVAAVDEVWGRLSLWDAATCQLQTTMELPKRGDGLVAPAFTADGKTVAVAARIHIVLVAVDGSHPPHVIAGAHEDRVQSLVFTSDGTRLISSGMGEQPQIRIWDVAKRELLRQLSLPAGLEGGCLVSLAADDKTLVSLHGDRTLVWDLTKDVPVRTLDGLAWPTMRGKALVDPRGKYLATAPRAKTFVATWDLATGKPLLAPASRHSSSIMDGVFSEGGRMIATGGSDNEVHLWNAESGEHLRTIRNKDGWIRGLAFHDDDRRLLVTAESHELGAGYFGVLFAFDVATGRQLFEAQLPERAASMSLAPSGKTVAVVTRHLGEDGGAAA